MLKLTVWLLFNLFRNFWKIDEDIVTFEIFSFRFIHCSVWLYLGVHRLYTSTFFCHYPVLLLAFVSVFFFFFFFTSVYNIVPSLHFCFKHFKDILFHYLTILLGKNHYDIQDLSNNHF